jgi:asparagine synthase (glutamine-hydrolysing)
MCGIAGIISPNQLDHKLLEAMTDTLRHRGPDNRGFFQDGILSFGHRRLSIIDLSPEANQPMSNEDGSIHLVCNGEIYNYKEKTAELKARGHLFASKSDCEVLIHLYEEYGTDFLNGVNGMYALALWDARKKRMLAAVDRFGKKPLYYAVSDERLLFASEMKSLLHFDWVGKDPEPLAIDRYLSLRHVPAPLTILKSVKKLEQSTMMIWQDGNLSFKRYWVPKPLDSSSGQSYVDGFEEILTDAVRQRLQSDVPLGVYLSGGVDSAAVSGLMRNLTDEKKISYTLSLDYQYNEHQRAERVAKHLNYEYNPVTVTGDDFDLMPDIMYHLDEPFGDMLCLPAFLLARKAKEKLTVVLTGDGADEILNGYFHQKLMILREKYKVILKTPGIGAIFAGISKNIPSSLLNRFFDYPDQLGPRELLKLSHSLAGCSAFGAFYDGITSCFTAQDKARLYTPSFSAKLRDYDTMAENYQREIRQESEFSFYSKLSLLDLKYWIPFSVLYRLDKMNMAHAVETRSPFLDYRVVEYALNLPEHWKLNKNRNKEVLRSLIERLYPPSLREKGKQAFYMPITSSYKQRYNEWITALLTPKVVEARGFFQWSYIDNLFQLVYTGSMLATRQLTALAMMELWFKVFIDGDSEYQTEASSLL